MPTIRVRDRRVRIGLLVVAAVLAGVAAVGTSVAASAGAAATPARSASDATATVPAPPLPGVRTEVRTLGVGARERSYLSLVPLVAHGPVPLVVLLHGRGQTPASALAATGLAPLAEDGRAVLLAPAGTDRSWNAGDGCCGTAGRTRVDDAAFVRAAIADEVRRLPGATDRTVLVGYSNGGKLAYALACNPGERYAGVATYGAVPLTPCSGPAPPPTSYLLGAGTADPVLPYAGRRSAGPPLPSVAAAVDGLRARDGCAGAPATAATPRERTAASGCTARTTVTVVTFPGQGHAWPRATTATGPGMTELVERFLAATAASVPGAQTKPAIPAQAASASGSAGTSSRATVASMRP